MTLARPRRAFLLDDGTRVGGGRGGGGGGGAGAATGAGAGDETAGAGADGRFRVISGTGGSE